MHRFLLFLTLLAPMLCYAAGTQRLTQFFDRTTSLRAQFEQVVTDSGGKKVQEVSGTMQILRPGKFRWDYRQPYQQEIVGDGKRIWLYDPELNQVTVRNMSEALGASPAALLSGSREIEKNFTLQELEARDGLEWISARPKDAESGFDEVRLGFGKLGLERMELLDSYGNLTAIRFSSMEINPALAQQIFEFKPPAGADIVGE
ncbi:MAG TPA: outer membrane lipoprotein chaperone LolA [Methylophilaceae bacterium]|jgi:outer membrane lipoprotein carrier protein